MSRQLRKLALWSLAVTVLALPSAWALQRTVDTKVHNHAAAPVIITSSSATLVETYAAPTQVPLPNARIKRSRVRYANRAGLAPSTFILNGKLVCRNQGQQPVEAIAVTVVLLDAFHQPVRPAGQKDDALVRQLVVQLPRRAEQTITWEQPLAAADAEVFEVALIVTRVRFTDGTVWSAPDEEVIDIF
jgi:hypothetical protein